MATENGFLKSPDLTFISQELAQSLWRQGTIYLEQLYVLQGTEILTEQLLRMALDVRELLAEHLDDTLIWWASECSPCFEPCASNYFEAAYRRIDRICRYAFYAGKKFASIGSQHPLVPDWKIDYEFASAFIRSRIPQFDLRTAISGFRQEVFCNASRPMCSLPWQPAYLLQWRMRMYTDMLEATPIHYWALTDKQLLLALKNPTEPGKIPSRLTADPETRAVSLDGEVLALNLTPMIFEYVSAVIAAQPHPIPFHEIEQRPGLKGKHRTRLRRQLEKESPQLASLVTSDRSGHFFQLPPK